MVKNIFKSCDKKEIAYVLSVQRDRAAKSFIANDNVLSRHISKSLNVTNVYDDVPTFMNNRYGNFYDNFLFTAVKLNIDKEALKAFCESNYDFNFRCNTSHILNYAKQINPDIIYVVLKRYGNECDIFTLDRYCNEHKTPAVVYGILNKPVSYLPSDATTLPAICTFGNIDVYRSLVLPSFASDMNTILAFQSEWSRGKEGVIDPKNCNLNQDVDGNILLDLFTSYEFMNEIRKRLNEALIKFIDAYDNGKLKKILKDQKVDYDFLIKQFKDRYIDVQRFKVCFKVNINKQLKK